VNYYVADRWNVTNTTTLAVVKGWIDDAIARNALLTLTFHDIVTTPSVSTEWATADFQSLCDYIVQSGINVITAADLYDARLGPIQIPRVG
jgi:hypothetical protein